MKRKFLLFLLILFLPAIVFAQSTGTLLPSPAIVPPGNTYGIAYNHQLIGGYQYVATIIARNAISSLRRQENMLCYVKETNLTYRLVDGVDNSNWQPLPDGSGWTNDGTNVYLTNSSGNVGIGTSQPAATLDVIGRTQTSSLSVNGQGEEHIRFTNIILDAKVAGPGILQICARNMEEGGNQCMNWDFSTFANTLRVFSPTGATNTAWFGTFSVDDKLRAPIVEVGGSGNTAWDLSGGKILAAYNFEEITGTTIDNVEGNAAYDGTSSVDMSTLTAPGIIGQGVNFPGNQTISLGAGLKFVHDMFACFAVKTTDSGSITNLGGNRSNSLPNNGWKIAMGASGLPTFLIDGGASYTAAIAGGVAINDGAKHLVCGSRKEGEYIKIFEDGVPAGTFVDTTISDIGTNADNTKIGDIPLINQSNGDPFVGLIDLVRLGAYAPTDDEMAGLWNNGLFTEEFSGGSGAVSACILLTAEDKVTLWEFHADIAGPYVIKDTNNKCDGI